MSASLTIQSDYSTAWSATGAGAGCDVASGPTADDASIPISARGTVKNSAGATHTFSYYAPSSGVDAGTDTDAGF